MQYNQPMPAVSPAQYNQPMPAVSPAQYNKPMPEVSPAQYNKPMPEVSPAQYVQPMPSMMPMMCCPYLMNMQCPMTYAQNMFANPMMNSMLPGVSPAMANPNQMMGGMSPYDMGYPTGQYQLPMSGM